MEGIGAEPVIFDVSGGLPTHGFFYWKRHLMSKIRQIDYTTLRILVSYSGKRTVRMTGQENRYKFSGILISGVEDEFAKIGDERKDWQKSAFPLPWTDSPDVVEP